MYKIYDFYIFVIYLHKELMKKSQDTLLAETKATVVV